jgi:flagellar biosynthesis/type III secretory pathway protein FliH
MYLLKEPARCSAKITARIVSRATASVTSLKQASSIIEWAKQQADKELSSARNKAQALLKKTRQRARYYTKAKVKKELNKKLASALIEQQIFYQRTINAANRDCTALAISIAEEIVGASVESETNFVSSRIQRALASLSNLRRAHIRVAKQDQQAVHERLQLLYPELDLKVEACHGFCAGEAEVCSVAGTIEISWKRELEQAKSQISSRLESILMGAENGTGNETGNGAGSDALSYAA